MGRDSTKCCTDSKILALMQPQKTEKRWNHTFPPFLCFCGYIRARIFQSVRFYTVYSWGCRDLIQVLSCWLLLLHSNNTWIFESVGLWFLLLHSIQLGSPGLDPGSFLLTLDRVPEYSRLGAPRLDPGSFLLTLDRVPVPPTEYCIYWVGFGVVILVTAQYSVWLYWLYTCTGIILNVHLYWFWPKQTELKTLQKHGRPCRRRPGVEERTSSISD